MRRLIGINTQIQQSQDNTPLLNSQDLQIQEKVPQEYQHYLQELQSLLEYSINYSDLNNHRNQWKYVDTKQGITAHYSKKEKNLVYRGEGVLQENIKNIGNMVFNLHEKKQYVEALQEYSSLDIINGSMYIAYIRLKSPIGIQDRDLVTLTGVFKNKNDDYVIIQKSIPYPQKKSPKNTIRANLIFQTWILQKLDENNTKITLVGAFDANGSIPQFIKNQVAKNQGFTISYIQEYLQQNKVTKN